MMTEQTGTSPAPPSILIVEDSPVEAELLRRTLFRAGYAVSVARNGEEGLQAARAQRPALVMSDIRMPVMDGYRLCRAIKFDDELWNIPLILHTVLSEPDDIIEAINSGADAYILKPFNETNLLDRIRSLLDAPVERQRADERRQEVVGYGGKRYSIAGGGQQILNLLLSLYENTLNQNRELTFIQTQLNLQNDNLDQQVRERTAALRESEARFRSLVETTNDWIWEIDENSAYTYVNPRIQNILGYLPEEMTGKTPFDLMPAEEARQVAKLFSDKASAREAIVNLEIVNLHKDGHRVTLETSAVPIIDRDGKFRGYRGIDRDITLRKQAEENIRTLNAELEQRVKERTANLEAVNKELEAFSYSVSHDLRAPLRAIDGFAAKVVKAYGGRLDDEGRRLLHAVRGNAMRMNQLIDDLLGFSRMGRSEMALQPLDMDAMARTVAAELRAAEPQRAIEFAFSPLPPACGDASMIRQVWVNLLGNAIKFTGKRQSAHIEVGGHTEGMENIYWVRDDGAGFDMRYAARLFGVFQRMHSEEEFEGTGIGLAIAQHILHRHHGRIWGEGKPDAGATFWFALPLPDGEHERR